MPPTNGNDWSVWSRHVLHELERLSACVESVEKKMVCDVHNARLDSLERSFGRLVGAFITITVMGMVFGIWMRVAMAG